MRLPSLCVPVVLATVLAACDATPGPDALGGLPPELSDLAYTPTAVSLVAGDPYTVEDDVALVPLTLDVRARDADGAVQEVAYVVQTPDVGADPLAAGTLTAAGDGRYRAETTLRIPVAEVRLYTVLVYAVDDDGLLSNQLRGLLPFTGRGQPPVIEAVEADPAVVVPPTTLRLFATVSDPDGLDNVLRVEGTTPNGGTFELFDDGVSRGDETAGDGRFTATFEVPSATPGIQTFSFKAVDKAGLESDVATLDVTVQ